MAAISSRQFIGWPVSASTLAAASSALSFWAVAVLRPFLGFPVGAGAGLPRAAAGFLALAAREVGEVVLALLMGGSLVANPMEWLPSSGGGDHPPRRPP